MKGVAGLWRGNGLNVARAVAAKGTLFSTQDALREVSEVQRRGGGGGGAAGAWGACRGSRTERKD